MTRKEYYERRRRKRRIQIIKRCTLAGGITLTAILLIMLIVKIASALSGGNEDKDQQASNTNPTLTATPTSEPTPKPGEAIKQTYTGDNASTGWVLDEMGNRYFPETNSYYVGGWKEIENATYYFDVNGYRLTGWQTIENTSHFFDKEGKLNPDMEEKLIAITYDDGSSIHTTYLLDILEEHNAKATFFILGNRVEQFRDTIKRMNYLGMEIGNHTFGHDNLTELDAAGIQETLSKTDEALMSAIGRKTTLIRPVGGFLNDTVKSTVSLPLILWNIDTTDWKTLDADQVADTIMENVSDGSIILMHDLYTSTIDATKVVVPKLIEQGYRLVTVSELAQARGIELNAGTVYGSFPKPTPEPSN